VVDMHHQQLSTHVSSIPHQQTPGQRHLQWHKRAETSTSLCQKVCGTDIVRITIIAGLIYAFGGNGDPYNTIEMYSTTGGGTLLPYALTAGGGDAAAVAIGMTTEFKNNIYSFYFMCSLILQGLQRNDKLSDFLFFHALF